MEPVVAVSPGWDPPLPEGPAEVVTSEPAPEAAPAPGVPPEVAEAVPSELAAESEVPPTTALSAPCPELEPSSAVVPPESAPESVPELEAPPAVVLTADVVPLLLALVTVRPPLALPPCARPALVEVPSLALAPSAGAPPSPSCEGGTHTSSTGWQTKPRTQGGSWS